MSDTAAGLTGGVSGELPEWACPDCGGSGETWTGAWADPWAPCRSCNGSGEIAVALSGPTP